METIIIAILVLVVVLAGVGYYVFFMRPKDPNAAQKSANDEHPDMSVEDANQMMTDNMQGGQNAMPTPPMQDTMPQQNTEMPDQNMGMPTEGMGAPEQNMDMQGQEPAAGQPTPMEGTEMGMGATENTEALDDNTQNQPPSQPQ